MIDWTREAWSITFCGFDCTPFSACMQNLHIGNKHGIVSGKQNMTMSCFIMMLKWGVVTDKLDRKYLTRLDREEISQTVLKLSQGMPHLQASCIIMNMIMWSVSSSEEFCYAQMLCSKSRAIAKRSLEQSSNSGYLQVPIRKLEFFKLEKWSVHWTHWILLVVPSMPDLFIWSPKSHNIRLNSPAGSPDTELLFFQAWKPICSQAVNCWKNRIQTYSIPKQSIISVTGRSLL